MTEIKSYGHPPALVETVMQAVMTLQGKEPTWAEAKRQLGERHGAEFSDESKSKEKLLFKRRLFYSASAKLYFDDATVLTVWVLQ